MDEVNSNRTNDYRSILKATSLFGGVQIFKILIEIIKQKFIAILLGPNGIGIIGLYLSSTSIIQNISSMGLSSSAVKNVAEASGTGDQFKISQTINILRKLVWVTGVLGMTLVIILSPYLSKLTFGNYDFTISFIYLSVSLLFQQLTAGQLVILQGLRKLNQLAKTNIIGSFLGLIFSIPLYYFFEVKGIVPSIIVSSILTFSLSRYYSNKCKIEYLQIPITQSIKYGSEMIKMGIVMSVNSILVLISAYVIRLYIMTFGGTEYVGLYTAGFTIINGYVGLVFNAMGTDYYPKLALNNKNTEKCTEIVNQQTEIALLIILPIIMIFLISSPFIISLLYSNQFYQINGFMQITILGMIFKTSSWTIAFQFIAKSEMKFFIKNELFANIYFLIFNIIGFYLLKFEGLGLSFLLSFIIYLIQVYYFSQKKYNFKFTRHVINIMATSLLLSTLCFSIVYFSSSFFPYCFAILITLISCIYSFYGLNKRINFLNLILNKQ